MTHYLQHFIIEGKHLGTAVRSKELIHSDYRTPRPTAFFCPKCAEIWARCPIEREGTVGAEWEVISRVCRKHQSHYYHTPGSIDCSWKPDFVAAFPDEVIRWEFQRELEYYFNERKEA